MKPAHAFANKIFVLSPDVNFFRLKLVSKDNLRIHLSIHPKLNSLKMKTKLVLFTALIAMFFIVSFKKDSSNPQITFTNNSAQGAASPGG